MSETTTLAAWDDEDPEEWWPPELEAEERAPKGPEAGPAPAAPAGLGRGRGEVAGEAGEIHAHEPQDGGVRGAGPDPRAEEPADGEALLEALGGPLRRRTRRPRTVRRQDRAGRLRLDARQRLLMLDAWLRSKLPAKDFAGLVGVSQHTLYKWKQRFEQEGPAGLADRPKGTGGKSRLADATKRAILMLKEAHPEWGQDRIHHVLMRTEGFSASSGAIGRVLADAGYEVEHAPTRPHPDKKRRFERARANQLWQTDLFTFVLKRENRRVHLVAYMDDHSRFLVGWGLHASASSAMVREVFESGVANFGAPEEVLTDNGSQYHTWRGKSAFRRLLDRRGIRQIVARPRHPQTLGKIERFWGTLWRELLDQAIFRGIDDARVRIGHFVSYYNFQRPHQGIGGSVPADRFFDAESQVRRVMEARIRANALDLARHGEPRKPVYLTGRVGDEQFGIHTEGGKLVYTRGDGTREEVDVEATGRREVRQEHGDDGDVGAEPEHDHAEPDCEEDDEPTVEDGPPIADGAPPDHAATSDDSVEQPPGGSVLDDVLADLVRRWQEDAPRDGESTEKGGER